MENTGERVECWLQENWKRFETGEEKTNMGEVKVTRGHKDTQHQCGGWGPPALPEEPQVRV